MLNPYESPRQSSEKNFDDDSKARGPQHMLIITVIGIAILSIGICVLLLFG